MYTNENLNIKKIVVDAKNYVLINDRKSYLPVLRAIESYIVNYGNEKIYVGGRLGIHALCNISQNIITADMWIMNLFSIDIENDMKKCMAYVIQKLQDDKYLNNSDNVYNGDYRTAVLRTHIPNSEYSFFLDYRCVAIGQSLGKKRNIEILNIIKPTITIGPFGSSNVPLMPRDVQIMIISHTLYDPSYTHLWSTIFIPMLCALFALPDPKIGGLSNIYTDSSLNLSKSSNSNGDDLLKSAILLGEYAISLYMDLPLNKQMRKQYICSFNDIDSKYFIGNDTSLHIPDDFRLYKMILHNINDNSFVADVFNSISYEVIPVNHIGEYIVASPLVILRFIYVDIWAINFIIATSDEHAAKKLLQRQQYLQILAQKFFNWIMSCSTNILFPTEYIGTHIAAGETKMNMMRKNKSQKPIRQSEIAKNDLINLYNEILDRIQKM